MNLLTESALVLRRNRHLEHDARLIVLLRNEGKVLVTIKGAARMSSRLRVFQEPFTRADMQLYLPPQGLYARLIQGTLVRTHQHLRQNPSAFHAACRAVETVDVLLPFRAPSPEAFDILEHTLDALDKSAHVTTEWVLFVLRLLKALGHGDHSKEVLKWLHPDNPTSMERAVTAVEAELERVLPRKLKSSELSLEHA
jgi:DNA repair protein RecO